MIVACRHCGQPFEYWEEGTKGWMPREGVEIRCPHCGAVHGLYKTIGYVRSRPLTEQERSRWEKSSPKD